MKIFYMFIFAIGLYSIESSPTRFTKIEQLIFGHHWAHKQDNLPNHYKKYTNTATMVQHIQKNIKLSQTAQSTALLFLQSHTKMLDQALITFNNKPGFDRTLQQLITTAPYPNIAKGYLYELETALACTQSNKQALHVVAFNHIIESLDHKYKRQFDVITQECLLECKTICWHNFTPLCERQLTEQKHIVDSINTHYCINLNHLLCSKKPIPKKIQSWLHAHHIDFIESN